LQLEDIEFFAGNERLEHCDDNLANADSISISFALQKNKVKYEKITMWKSDDKVLCPVKRWASIVQRIRSYPGSNSSTPVNRLWDHKKGKYTYITADTIAKTLKQAVREIGSKVLGFGPEDVGCHSLRSGAAMAMYLTNTPIYTIMLIGRWTSDSWLRYIRPQVQDFTRVVSKNMISSESFFTIPSEKKVADPRCTHFQKQITGCGSHFGLPAVAASRFSLTH